MPSGKAANQPGETRRRRIQQKPHSGKVDDIAEIRWLRHESIVWH
jgi:hypothetical protein